MIEVSLDEGCEESATRRFLAAASRFSGNEYRIDFRQNIGVVEFEYPAICLLIVAIENSQAADAMLK